MKTYDLIAIGTGSAMMLVEPYLQMHPGAKIAVIDKDPPGGICLTKGCVPTKMLLYPAEVVRIVEEAQSLGIRTDTIVPEFESIMTRMRRGVGAEIQRIESGLKRAKDIDYYRAPAEFTAPYTLKIGGKSRIKSRLIMLCTGSKPHLPDMEGLDRVTYHTSDTILDITTLPTSIAIIGGGYIAAEYGHFFAAMGAEVTLIGRNPQFLPEEEPEVSRLAAAKMSPHMKILIDHEALRLSEDPSGLKQVEVLHRSSGRHISVTAEQMLVATGRSPNTDLLQPTMSGIKVDEAGWIVTDEYLETSQPNIWAFGDANGRHLFKHVANHEAQIVYYNALLKERVKVNYHAVPHAVFTWPEIASVGMKEADAVQRFGPDNVLIGFQRFERTTKGDAMGLNGYFAKVIADDDNRILGAHIIGPQASVLIQEVVNLMYTPQRVMPSIVVGMHIHPSLSEVIERAFLGLMPQPHYRQLLEGGRL